MLIAIEGSSALVPLLLAALVHVRGALVGGLLERRRRVGVIDQATPADLARSFRLACVARAGLGAVVVVIFAAKPR